MANIFVVAVVECLKGLFYDLSSLPFFELALHVNLIKEVPTVAELHHEMEVKFVHIGLMYLNDVWVVHVFHDVVLELYQVDVVFDGFSEDALDGYFLQWVGVVLSGPDLPKLALSYHLSKFVNFFDVFPREPLAQVLVNSSFP